MFNTGLLIQGEQNKQREQTISKNLAIITGITITLSAN